MKKFALLLFLFPTISLAQFTSVTATVVDSDSQAWKNGYWSATLYNPVGQIPPQINGVRLTPAQLNPSGSLDNSGVMNTSLADNSQIAPAGTYWQFIICPQVSIQCSVVNTAVTGASENISAIINAGIKAPRLPASPYAYAYSDTEINPIPNPGGFYFNVSTLSQRIWNGTAWQNGGGGTTIVGSVFWSLPGDTLSTIETECSSVCTYFVTLPQAIALSGNHTLSSKVNLFFLAGGKWTITGGTLTISGNVQGDLNQHFASNVAFGELQKEVPAEWFGAIGDWTGTPGTSTDNQIPFTNALASLTSGQMIIQSRQYYMSTCGLTITHSNVGIKGVNYHASPTADTSAIVCGSAAANIINVTGTSSTFIQGNKFENFNILRSVIPSGSAKGMNLNYINLLSVTNVISQDSIYDFYLDGVKGSWFTNDFALWGFNGVVELTGSLYGFYVDSTGGTFADSSNSTFYTDCVTNSLLTPGTASVTGFKLIGAFINDMLGTRLATNNGDYGIWIEYTGGTGADSDGDMHFTDSVLDTCQITCITVKNVTNLGVSAIQFTSGWINFKTASPGIDINNSQGIDISGFQIFGSLTTPDAIFIHNGSTGNTITHNIVEAGTNIGVHLTSVVGNTVTANAFNTAASAGISLDGTSANNVISSNVFQGMPIAINIASTVTNTVGLETNTYTATVTQSIGFPGGNQGANPTIIPAGIVDGGAYVSKYASTPFISWDFNNGSHDSPAVRFYSATNDNIGFNNSNIAVPTGCTTSNVLRFVRKLGETGGFVIGAMDGNGILCGLPGIVGVATAPSGSCSNTGEWVFSTDGHATFCNGSTWVTKI